MARSAAGKPQRFLSARQTGGLPFANPPLFCLPYYIMKRIEKTPMDPELKSRIHALMRFKGGGQNEEGVADIVEDALKILKDVKDTGGVRVIQAGLGGVPYAFR